MVKWENTICLTYLQSTLPNGRLQSTLPTGRSTAGIADSKYTDVFIFTKCSIQTIWVGIHKGDKLISFLYSILLSISFASLYLTS